MLSMASMVVENITDSRIKESLTAPEIGMP